MSLARPVPGTSGAMVRGMAASVFVHGGFLALGLWWATRPAPPHPPVYRVELVGQAGPRQAGVETPGKGEVARAADVAGAERVVKEEKVLPTTTKAARPVPTPKATPSTERSRAAGSKTAPATETRGTAAPRSGAGATDGKGADVANLRTDGIVFPFPGYLSNIVRQITLNWSPRRTAAALVTEVKFMIRRDGSVAGIEIVKASGDRLYDLDAMGAIEAVGSTRAFGALPSGWSDDVLVVYFTFDYALRPQ